MDLRQSCPALGTTVPNGVRHMDNPSAASVIVRLRRFTAAGGASKTPVSMLSDFTRPIEGKPGSPGLGLFLQQRMQIAIRRARMCPPKLVATLWMLQICICNLRKSTSCFVGLTLQGASLALQGASRLRWQSFVVAGRKSSRSLWPGPKAAWPSTFMASKGLGAAWSWHRLWFNGLPASVEAALQKQSELTNYNTN